MWDGTERRKFLRAQYPCLITLRKKTAPPFSILTHTEDISVGGVRVILGRQIEISTEVDLEIDLQDTMPNVASTGKISWVRKILRSQKTKPPGPAPDVKILKGAVAWIKEIPAAQKGDPSRYDTGIQFTALDDKDKQRIKDIVNRFSGKRSS